MKKQWYRKTGNALLSVVILGFAMTIALTACKSEDDGYTDELSEVNLQRWSRNEHLVALAVCRVYDGKAMTLKSSGGSLEDSSTSPLINPKSDVEYPSIKYEFDFIKIGDAVHYLARGVNFPFLNEICGKGEIEVFMTYFHTYKYADEKKDESRLSDLVSDGLIVFRGERGVYACMVNSGSSENGVNESVFSSHKRFAGNAVEKNFTPPIYEFRVKSEKNRVSLACNVVVDNIGNLQNNRLQWTDLKGGDIVSSDKLFSTIELSAMPEITLQCSITGIGEDYFLVAGKSNLEKLFFDEYTLFFAKDKPAASSDFAIGDNITVTFDRLFERYNPKVALANKIVK